MKDKTIEIKATLMESVEDYKYLVKNNLLTRYAIQATLGKALELFGTHWWTTYIVEMAGDDGVVNDARITVRAEMPFAEVPIHNVMGTLDRVDRDLMDNLAEAMVSNHVAMCRNLMKNKDYDTTGLELFYELTTVTASPEALDYVTLPEVHSTIDLMDAGDVKVSIIPMLTFTWSNLISYFDIFGKDADMLIDK